MKFKRNLTKWGISVLRRLQGLITTVENAKESLEDGVSTKNEYAKMQEEFVNSEDKAVACDKLSNKAKKYGIFEIQNAV